MLCNFGRKLKILNAYNVLCGFKRKSAVQDIGKPQKKYLKKTFLGALPLRGGGVTARPLKNRPFVRLPILVGGGGEGL